MTADEIAATHGAPWPYAIRRSDSVARRAPMTPNTVSYTHLTLPTN